MKLHTIQLETNARIVILIIRINGTRFVLFERMNGLNARN
jgi:hypothetical protein